MAHPGGRPTDYTPELAKRICELVASTALSMEAICKSSDDFPEETTAFRWIARHEQFRRDYLEAKELQGLILSEKILSEAYTCPAVTEEIALANHQFRVTQWHLSKLAPKQFGDKKEVKTEMNLNVHEADLAHLK